MNAALHQLRFQHEQQLYQQLQQRDFVQAYQQQQQPQQQALYQRHLLGSAVKVNAGLLPELNQTYKDCLALLDMPAQGDIYIYQSSDYNAYVFAEAEHFDISISSALVKDFSAAEIRFVMGHELGHVLFQHQLIPAGLWLNTEEQKLSDNTLLQLFKWSRAAELSADRIGFLSCGDLSAAANAFFKLACGLSLDNDQQVVLALRQQYDEIERINQTLLGRGGFDAHSHPLIPIRFKSLELVSLDLLSYRRGKILNPDALRQIDHQVESVLVGVKPPAEDSIISNLFKQFS